ncbi:unnamed protein product, partial [Gulo gulo]
GKSQGWQSRTLKSLSQECGTASSLQGAPHTPEKVLRRAGFGSQGRWVRDQGPRSSQETPSVSHLNIGSSDAPDTARYGGDLALGDSPDPGVQDQRLPARHVVEEGVKLRTVADLGPYLGL